MNLNSVVSTYKNRPYTLDPRPLESLGTFFLNFPSPPYPDKYEKYNFARFGSVLQNSEKTDWW